MKLCISRKSVYGLSEGSVLDQYWDKRDSNWAHTLSLTRKLKSGKSQTVRILEDRAKEFPPQPFVSVIP